MKKRFLFPVILVGLLAAGCGNDEETSTNEAPERNMGQHMETRYGDDFEMPMGDQISHIHGMGFIEEEEGLYFASHHGLRIYRDGQWAETAEHPHDYMGFNAVDRGFYSSGHPGMGSDMQNPIGIYRSMDGGRNLEHMGFEGESDFHAMAVGYRSHHIFLMNPEANSRMQRGFYRSVDEGESWDPVEPQGLDGEVLALSMHPDNSDLIAAATSGGVFLSEDGGENFSQLTAGGESGTAVYFTDDDLFYGSYGTEPALIQYSLETEETEALTLPEMSEDAVAYIAQNPKDENELAISTFEVDAFISMDGGQNWEQILDNGQQQ
ncbi:MAG TPA: hypothetical protein VK945_00400 [Planococcus sp. (in: firmicutes)]|nr:hypothetical protein [Planococcus sp. (in: firmicutes)]